MAKNANVPFYQIQKHKGSVIAPPFQKFSTLAIPQASNDLHSMHNEMLSNERKINNLKSQIGGGIQGSQMSIQRSYVDKIGLTNRGV